MNCVICLSVYNNEFGLPYCLNNIKKLEPFFKKLNIVAFFDLSKDKSLKILIDFKRNNSIEFDIIINKKDKSNVRTENIAFARNSLLENIKEKFANYEYFIMMDTNEYACIGDINVNVFKFALENNALWDAISFDREAGYYDTWALSFDPFIYSFFHFTNSSKVVGEMRSAFNLLLADYKINKPEKLIPVYSAFNGFSIYKTTKFLNCSYSSNIQLDLFPADSIKNQTILTNTLIVNNFSNDCEHRKFHLEAIKKNNAKIMISTKFLFSKFIDPPPNLRGPA